MHAGPHAAVSSPQLVHVSLVYMLQNARCGSSRAHLIAGDQQEEQEGGRPRLAVGRFGGVGTEGGVRRGRDIQDDTVLNSVCAR